LLKEVDQEDPPSPGEENSKTDRIVA